MSYPAQKDPTKTHTSRAFAVLERHNQMSKMASDPECCPTLSATDFSVLKEMNTFSGISGESCYPSLSTVAKRTRHSRSTVVRAVKRLRAAGLLKVTTSGLNVTTNYRIALGGVPVTYPTITTTPPSVTSTPPDVTVLSPPCHHDTASGVPVTHKQSNNQASELRIKPSKYTNNELAPSARASLVPSRVEDALKSLKASPHTMLPSLEPYYPTDEQVAEFFRSSLQ
jgi:DNA-binding Lrp family transcriptional regulator